MKKTVTKKQMGGSATGRSISEKAAARKVAKGKGIIAKSYPSGPEEKGSYVGYSKEARKSSSPFISMKDSKKPRPIQKKGGVVKKQMGGSSQYDIVKEARAKRVAGDTLGYYETLMKKGPLTGPMLEQYKKLKAKKSKNSKG